MNNERRILIFNTAVSAAGLFLLLNAAANIAVPAESAGLLLLMVFLTVVAPRFNITLQHAGATLSFSEAIIFSSVIFGLGHWAVLFAAVDVIANFLSLRTQGIRVRWKMLPLNIGLASIATGISLFVYQNLLHGSAHSPSDAPSAGTVSTLTVLALSQFFLNSSLTSVYYSIARSENLVKAWKENGLPLSITHFVGALFAGLAYVIWNSGDLLAGAMSVLVIAILYLSYRQIIANMTSSLEAAAKSEREKTEIEREKRLEVERYAGELTTALLKEEATSRALRESENAFRYAALHDALTRLPNRAHFSQELEEAIDRRTYGGGPIEFVMFLDLSRFKTVNDMLGHGTGDRVLEVAAMRFKKLIGPDDFAARIGGDEFAMIVRSVDDAEKAEKFAWDIHRKLSEPISIEGQRVNIGINIGVAPLTEEYKFPEEILRDADIAMHHASSRGTGVEMFSAEIREASLGKARIESDLPVAIEREEFLIHYQPLVSLKDGSLIGAEALLRWNHPQRGLVSPGEFIPVAEENGLIIPMTRWILERACSDLADWRRSAEHLRELMVSVNISGRHLAHQSLVGDVKHVLEKTNLEPHHLKLEITETVAMDNPEESKRAFNELKRLGVQLSIDDFGTGYSSLSYLHQLPFDTLKIDRSFVINVGENGENSEVLETIVALAKNLRMRVIAEGVETVEQLGLLRSLGCDYGQGFLMSRPMPVEAFAASIVERKSWLPQPKRPKEAHPPEDDRQGGNVVPIY